MLNDLGQLKSAKERKHHLGPCSPEGDELLETPPGASIGAGGPGHGFGTEAMAGEGTPATASWKSWRSWRKFLLHLCLESKSMELMT